MQFLLSAILVLALQSSTNDSLLIKQTQNQVREYVNHIQQNENKAINLWALSTVIEARSELRDYFLKYASQMELNRSLIAIFKDSTLSHASRLQQLAFQAKSPLLLTAYILNEPVNGKRVETFHRYKSKIGYRSNQGVHYRQIIQALLHQKFITNAMLPADQFYPLHYILFYHSDRNLEDLFSNEYLKKMEKLWAFPNILSLKQAMGIATLFKLYYHTFRYQKTLSLYHTLINNTIFPNYFTKLSLLRALDYSMYILGYYHRSVNIMSNYAIPLAQYLGLSKSLIQMKISNASNLYRIGKYESSRQINLASLKTKNINNLTTAKIYNNLAATYLKTGAFSKYYTYTFKALELARQEKNLGMELVILKNLFITSRKSGDISSAKTYLKKAQKVATKTNDQKNIAKLIFYEGMLFMDFKTNYDLALTSFKKAIAYLSLQKNYLYYQRISTEMAFIYEKQHQYQKALQQYNGVIARAKKRDDIKNVLESTIHKANVFLKTGQRDSVKAMLGFLQAHSLNNLDFDHIVKAKYVRAQKLINSGKTQQAYQLLKPTIKQVVLRSRASGDLETGFWQVEPEFLNAFEVMANLLIQTGRTEKAVEVLDQLKTINDAALYQNPLSRSQILNEKELSQYKRIEQKLNGLRKNLLTASKKQRSDIQVQIDKLSALKKRMDLKITDKAAIQPVSVNQIQRQLNAHERVLHFTELNDTYYFATISRNAVHFKKIPLTDSVRTLFENAIESLNSGATNLNQLYEITQLLGLNNFPVYVNSLTVMPDSYLYRLPLAVLPLNKPTHSYSYGSTRYLVERFQTNYKTSLNDFVSVQPQSKEPYGFVGYAVSKFNQERKVSLTPLPNADEEIKHIAKQLTQLDHKKLITNNEATEKAFRRFAPEARILHVATHSTVSSRNPLFSSIFLSPSKQTDDSQYSGRIFAYELFELGLDSDLVMLNSCESASGKYLQGTGIVGISRALRYAGVNALMLNLWPVNDKLAAEFAVKFYSHINEGLSKAEALRKTQLYFLANSNANPYYWAPYMLLGNAKPLIHPYKKTNRIAAISFMALFVTFTFASSFLEWKRKRN